MKKFNLQIKDKTGAEVLEGSVLTIITTRRKGYQEDGKVFSKKVVFGKTHLGDSVLDAHIGFFAVNMEESNTNDNGEINYYESVTTVNYLVDSQGAEVTGNVRD